jgi:hypothetical protein
MNDQILSLYNEYFTDRDFERLDLFQLLAERYGIRSAVYPGSYVHVTPAFVYPLTAFIDSDKRAKKFFADPGLADFIASRKLYPEEADFSCYPQSYFEEIPELLGRFDLLISQYAGFVSQHAKRYLRPGGYLLANNSHGDASMASIDEDFHLVAVVQGKDGSYRLTEKGLDSYMVPKKPVEITKALLEERQRGIGYTKAASMYVFQKAV